MTKYIIVTDQEKPDFIQRVNQRIEHGYLPLGGPFTTTFVPGHGNVHQYPGKEFVRIEYNQAMILESEIARGQS